MGLNVSLPYGIAATCEKLRPISSNISDHHCLQLRRCLVGSPGCRVEALQRFKFPQPAVCGGDIWSEKYPEHLWRENNLGLCSERVGASANTLRSWTYLLGWSSMLLGLIPARCFQEDRVQSRGGGWMVLHRSWWNGAVIPGTVRKKKKKSLQNGLVWGFFFLKKKSHWAILSAAAANHIFSTLK